MIRKGMSKHLNFLIIFLIAALLFLQYQLWLKPDGIRDMLVLKKGLAKQTIENEKLKKRNEELLAQIQQLQTNQEATESRARGELNMVKKGETFYQIIE